MADFDTQRSLQKNRIRRRGIYLLPNLFTTAALFAGFYAIVQAMNLRFDQAAVAIFVAMVLDGLDGRVARLTRTQSAFGAEYDSLSDMVSFGAAPALIVYEWALKGMGKLGWIAAFVYVAGAALRLARFNVMLDVADKRWFTGIPSPAAAALVAGLVWIVDDIGRRPGRPRVVGLERSRCSRASRWSATSRTTASRRSTSRRACRSSRSSCSCWSSRCSPYAAGHRAVRGLRGVRAVGLRRRGLDVVRAASAARRRRRRNELPPIALTHVP